MHINSPMLQTSAVFLMLGLHFKDPAVPQILPRPQSLPLLSSSTKTHQTGPFRMDPGNFPLPQVKGVTFLCLVHS